MHLAASSWIYTLSQREKILEWMREGQTEKSQTVCSALELKCTDEWRRKFHRKRRILWVPKMAGLLDVEFHLSLEVYGPEWSCAFLTKPNI